MLGFVITVYTAAVLGLARRRRAGDEPPRRGSRRGCDASIEVPIIAAPYLAICHLGLRRIERLATTT